MRIALALLLMTALPLAAQKRPAVEKKPSAAQLQAQVVRLTQEQEDLKQRLAASEGLRQELAGAVKARDLARTEAETARREADQLRALLNENQGGGDAILKELQTLKQAVAEAETEAKRLKAENESLGVRATPGEGSLVILDEEIQPARPVNLNRATPRLKPPGLFAGRSKGVVVVNVLISEKGDVLAARLIQGLPDEGPETRQTEAACVEAAKRIVFDPAKSSDGKTRFKVWQGVGFYLD